LHFLFIFWSKARFFTFSPFFLNFIVFFAQCKNLLSVFCLALEKLAIREIMQQNGNISREELEEKLVILEEKLWLDSSLTRFDDVLRSSYDKNLEHFAESVMFNLAQITGAIRGAFYIVDKTKENVTAIGGYACTPKSMTKANFLIGEGLVGQCARSKTPMHIDNVPPNNIYVEASIGQLSAQSITVVPLIFNDHVYGVFELIFLKKPENKFRDLLERISKNLAAMLQSIQNNEETKKLLELSVKQTEELRAAEEEMRQNMEELAATQEVLQRQQDEIAEQKAKSDEIRMLVQSVIDGYEALIFAKDESGKIILVNDAFVNFLSVVKSAVIDKKVRDLFPDAIDDILDAAEKKAFLGDKMQRFEASADFKSETKTFDITVFPLFNSNEIVYAVCFIMRDITEKALMEFELKEAVRKSQEQEHKLAESLEKINAAQQVLLKSENKFRGLVRAIDNSAAMIELEDDGTIRSANALAQNIFGLDKIIGKNLFTLLKENFENEAETGVFKNAVLVSGKKEADFKITLDGEQKWAEFIFTPMSGAGGFLVLGNDITEEKKNQLQAEKLSLVADNTGNSVIITDEFGRIEYVNNSFTTITGYTFEEVKGKKPGDVLQGKDTSAETKKLIRQKLNEKVPFSVEILNYGKAGNKYWISLVVNPIFDEKGNIKKFVAIQSDVTETKLKAMDYECKFVAINNTNAIVEFDLHGNIITANNLFLKTMGYSLEEIVGKHHSIFIEEKNRHSVEYKAFWQNSKNLALVDTFKRIDKYGSVVWLKGSYNTIIDAYGEPYRVIKVAQDITAQKMQEIQISQQAEELRATEEELRQNLEEVTATREELERQVYENEKIRAELQTRMNVLDMTAILSESDIYGTITYVNAKFVEITGYTPEECIGKPHKILRHPDNPKSLFKELWETIKAGRIFRGTYPNLAKDGSVYWVDATIAPVLNEKGEPVKYIGIRFDITERVKQEGQIKLLLEESKQANEELRATEEEIRQNLEEMVATQEELQRQVFANERIKAELTARMNVLDQTAILSESDLYGTITYVNEKFTLIAGYTPEECMGKPHKILRHPDNPKSLYKELWDTIKAGRIFRATYPNLAKDGSVYWVDATIAPVLNEKGEPVKYVGIRFDVTDLVLKEKENQILLEKSNQALEELRSSEEEIRQNMEELLATQEELSRASLDLDGQMNAIDRTLAMSEFDLDGTVLKVNDIFLKTTGYTHQEVIGKKHTLFLDSEYAESNEYRYFWNDLKSGKPKSGIVRRVDKNGNDIWLNATYSPVFDKSGTVVKIIKLASDVTEQTKKDFELRALYEALSETMPILEFSPSFEILFANELLLDLLNFGIEEIRGRRIKVILREEFMQSAKFKEIGEKFKEKNSFKTPFEVKSKDGKIFEAQTLQMPIFDTWGKLIKIKVLFINVLQI
jgi:PAS domain S-box-containing protein